jgi:hypothetical protein
VIAAEGKEIEEMGFQEAAEGLTRLVASEAMNERSDELAAAGVILGMQGATKIELAAAEVDLAREVGAVGVQEIAEGSAQLGKSTKSK